MVCTQANLVEVFSCSIRVVYGAMSVTYIRIRNRFIFIVLAIQESQFSSGHQFDNYVVQLQHVAAFLSRLADNVLFDLLLDAHIQF